MLSRVRIATRSMETNRTFFNPESGSPCGGGPESEEWGRSGSIRSPSPRVHFEMRVALAASLSGHERRAVARRRAASPRRGRPARSSAAIRIARSSSGRRAGAQRRRAGRSRAWRRDTDTRGRRPSAGCGRRSGRTAAVVEAMMPNIVPVGQSKALGRRRRSRSASGARSGRNARVESSRASRARETTRSVRPVRRAADVHVLDEPDLGAEPLARTPGATSSSSSLTPRMTTESILSPEKPARAAAAIPASTRGMVVEARQRLEAVPPQRVEADGHAGAARPP